jgi:cytoskeleton protein RodZ
MPTIGEQLKQARESRRLSIEQVVQAIRIRAYYLEAMEADDFSTMPSAAQARGFLRSYAGFLELDADELVNGQRNESAAPVESSTPAVLEKPAGPAPESQPPAEPPPPVKVEPQAPEVEVEISEPETAPEPAEPETTTPAISQLILVEIGRELHQRRELLSLTLDEIERHTRVRKHYLEKIEAGNYDQLPSPVQARGMLSNYASFLDMDAEALLLRYADALQARRLERQPETAPKSTLPRPKIIIPLWLGRFISPDLLFGGGMIVVLFILTLWGAVFIFSGGGAASSAPTQGPSISDVLLASPSASVESASTTESLPTSVSLVDPSSGLEQIIETPETTLTPELSSNVQVTLSVLERTFIRVTVDGEVEQEGRVAPGTVLPFQGNQRIEVLTGSGSAIQVLFNQRDLGTMGNFGEVVNLVYTIDGAQTPTPTPSPTVTVTPPFQNTASPAPTVTLTPQE